MTKGRIVNIGTWIASLFITALLFHITENQGLVQGFLALGCTSIVMKLIERQLRRISETMRAISEYIDQLNVSSQKPNA